MPSNFLHPRSAAENFPKLFMLTNQKVATDEVEFNSPTKQRAIAKITRDYFRNPQRPLSLGRVNWSSCPVAAVAQPRPEGLG
jgi:hypothetical protein